MLAGLFRPTRHTPCRRSPTLSYRAKQGSQILLSLDLFRPTHNFPDRVERDRIFQGGQISGVASFRSG
jgi:hypothetical protein